MENFFLEGTNKTPQLDFNSNEGRFLIAGRSIPENSIEFYKPLFEWLDNYVGQAKSNTILDVKLEYFNTSSSKCLVEIFRKLEALQQKNDNVLINWYYEEDDEDMQESGEDFQEIIDVKIVLNQMEEEE
ncbi:MAG: nuclear pore complex subunit [Flexibacter sp. CG_4_10_14_3_um_filter_32_15]|nr:MAG: nuclear pore complex subunit [Flexibacter sp. CG_4_10_14_3_um_filter_32_15]